jgi:hypothetical protein
MSKFQEIFYLLEGSFFKVLDAIIDLRDIKILFFNSLTNFSQYKLPRALLTLKITVSTVHVTN